MKTLSVRLVFNVMVPAAVGAAAAWMSRPDEGMSPAAEASAAVEKARPAAGLPSLEKKERPAFLPNSALADQKRFCERLQTADLTQMMGMLDEAQTFADAFRRRSARTLVMEQMARTDPAGTWALLEKWEKGSYRYQFLQAWAQVDADGALTWAGGQGKEEANFAREIIAGLVPDNMEAFTKILPRLKPDQIGKDQLGTTFRLMGSQDHATALSLLARLAGNGQHNFASSSLAEGWARRDAGAAYAWAKELTDPAQRESALRGVFRTWAETDPKGTAARLDELGHDPAMANAAAGESPVKAVVRAWAAQDPKAAAAWLRTRAAEAGEEHGNDLSFRSLLQMEILPVRDEWNAAEIANLIRKPGEKLVAEGGDHNSPFNHLMSSGDPDEDGGGDIIGEFGGYNSPLNSNADPFRATASVRIANPAQAFEDLAKQPGDASRQNVLHEVACQWAEQDPKAAMARLRETTDQWLKLGLINALTNRALQNNDPQMAAEIAKTYPESSGDQGQHYVREIYGNLARRDPDRARAMLKSDLDADGKTSLATALATQQATYDPAGAIKWAAEQADEKVRSGAMAAAVNSWAGADAYAASEWLAAEPAGPLREAAVRGLVQSLRQNSPDDALQWAATLTDPQLRESTQFTIVRNLMWNDLAKAKELAAGLQLSQPQRKELDQLIQSREKNGY